MAASLLPLDESFHPMPVKKSAALYAKKHGGPPPAPMESPDDQHVAVVARALAPVKRALPFIPGLAIVGGATAIGVLAQRLPLGRAMQRAITFGAAGVAFAGLALWQFQRILDEAPDYVSEGKVGELEVRRYSSRVQAETTVPTDDWDDALKEGFMRLAGYINGKNTPRRLTQRLSEKQNKAQRISMTTPVLGRKHANGHRIAFVMPKKKARGGAMALPLPEDPRITVQNLPPQRVAVLTFHGPYGGKIVNEKKAELLRLVVENGLIATGEPMFAGYDPPSTLPWFRRVEVWVPVV